MIGDGDCMVVVGVLVGAMICDGVVGVGLGAMIGDGDVKVGVEVGVLLGATTEDDGDV